jgi:hypothetical protein
LPLERLVYKHIYKYLIDNNLITSNQSGFTPGDSAVYQLLYITNEFGRALDEGKEVRAVFCDISKAFDMNKRGTKIDPWGTPAFMSRQLEVELLITTRCFLSDK